MLILQVAQLLKKKGKTKYWLYKQMGMSYQNFDRMYNNKTKSIRFENIEILCQLLECTPNDLFLMEEEPSVDEEEGGGGLNPFPLSSRPVGGEKGLLQKATAPFKIPCRP